MEAHSQRGQVVIELAVAALFLVAFFLMGFSLAGAASRSQEPHRFAKSRGLL